MSYILQLKSSARKEFMKLPPLLKVEVGLRLDQLQDEPRPRGAEALAGEFKGYHRLRIGEYRVVYRVDESSRTVTVTRIRPRGRAYK